MTTKYYTCELLSDVVLNSSLATEGNMNSLDYIPGSNFLGMVASKMYENDKQKSIDLFHNGKVKFGDATISNDNAVSYPIPFVYMMDKVEKDWENDTIYLHHEIDAANRPRKKNSDSFAQLKQLRLGYVFTDLKAIKEVKKRFALKSAQERETRNSKDGAMFGFEAIQKGQSFVFSINFEDESFVSEVESALIGIQRLGKSKNAEYGQVEIQKLEKAEQIQSFPFEKYVLVYAQSHLYFTDEFGQATLQPSAEKLGIEGGRIILEKSQIRSFSYSPWNGARNTTSTQRHCIARGSVFYVELKAKFDKVEGFVGGYQAEGLGKVLYNPIFLKNKGNELDGKIKLVDLTTTKRAISDTHTTPLTKFLKDKKEQKDKELKISQNVMKCINEEGKVAFEKIKSSQWGGIRSLATENRNMDVLHTLLFKDDEGFLKHGIAYEKQWRKDGNLSKFQKIVENQMNNPLGSLFIAKFAAEMAKVKQRKDKENGK
jgi:hypothetical protein